MTNDITLTDEITLVAEETAAPPLCLVHYFGATGQGPPAVPSIGRVVERDGNLIILEFVAPAQNKAAKPGSKKTSAKIADALFWLLLLTCLGACIAAFRF